MNRDVGHTDPEYRTYQPKQTAIRHYYGDLTRQILLCAAALMLVGAPFYTSDFKVQVPLIIIGAIVLVSLAGLLNPTKHAIAIATAIASGVGAIWYAVWALWFFSSEDPIAFVLRQACAILLIFAFYFAVKTVRAMLMGLIGRDTFGEDATERPVTGRKISSGAPEELDGLGRPAALEDLKTSD